MVSDELGWTDRPADDRVADMLRHYACTPPVEEVDDDEEGNGDSIQVPAAELVSSPPTMIPSHSTPIATHQPGVPCSSRGKRSRGKRSSQATASGSTPKKGKPATIYGSDWCINPNIKHLVVLKKSNQMHRHIAANGERGLLCHSCYDYFGKKKKHRPAKLVRNCLARNIKKYVEAGDPSHVSAPPHSSSAGGHFPVCPECGATAGPGLAYCSIRGCQKICHATCSCDTVKGRGPWLCEMHYSNQPWRHC